jgi:hypothetical protein
LNPPNLGKLFNLIFPITPLKEQCLFAAFDFSKCKKT